MPLGIVSTYQPAVGFFGQCFLEHAGSGTTNAALATVDSHTISASHLTAKDFLMIFAQVQSDVAGTTSDINLLVNTSAVHGKANQKEIEQFCRLSNDNITANQLRAYSIITYGQLANAAAQEPLINVVAGGDIADAIQIDLQVGKSSSTNALWEWAIYSMRGN